MSTPAHTWSSRSCFTGRRSINDVACEAKHRSRCLTPLPEQANIKETMKRKGLNHRCQTHTSFYVARDGLKHIWSPLSFKKSFLKSCAFILKVIFCSLSFILRSHQKRSELSRGFTCVTICDRSLHSERGCGLSPWKQFITAVHHVRNNQYCPRPVENHYPQTSRDPLPQTSRDPLPQTSRDPLPQTSGEPLPQTSRDPLPQTSGLIKTDHQGGGHRGRERRAHEMVSNKVLFFSWAAPVHGGPPGGNPLQHRPDEGPRLHQQSCVSNEQPGRGRHPNSMSSDHEH